MRRAYVVAGIGLLVLTASCSGKPNDLRHYADPVVTTTSTAGQSNLGPSSTTHSAAPTTSSTPDTTQLAAAVTAGLMVDASVIDIGFHPSVPQKTTVLTQLPVCSAPLGTPATGAQTGWIGASSVTTLTEYVAVYPKTTAAQVLTAAKAALTCSQATKYALAPTPTGVDASYSWCEKGSQPSCTLLLAKGHLLARVQVISTPETKAQNLIKEVAVPAAAALSATH